MSRTTERDKRIVAALAELVSALGGEINRTKMLYVSPANGGVEFQLRQKGPRDVAFYDGDENTSVVIDVHRVLKEARA